MLFVMSLSVDSSLATKSLDSHSQAITHTLCGPHKPAEGLLWGQDALIWGCGDQQINELCLHISPFQLELLSSNFLVHTFMIWLLA